MNLFLCVIVFLEHKSHLQLVATQHSCERLINNFYPLWIVKSEFILENIWHVHAPDALHSSHPSGDPEWQSTTTLANKQILHCLAKLLKVKNAFARNFWSHLALSGFKQACQQDTIISRWFSRHSLPLNAFHVTLNLQIYFKLAFITISESRHRRKFAVDCLLNLKWCRRNDFNIETLSRIVPLSTRGWKVFKVYFCSAGKTGFKLL